jgi:thiaminase/transcriptional activator TenA
MSVAHDLWAESSEMATRCLAHPFVRGIADGSLAPARYRRFIAQDAYFLEAFARGYAHCLARSPDRAGLYEFHRLLDGVFEELELHRGAAERLRIDLARVEPAPATLDYTRFLQEAIATGTTVGETLAAMTPCVRLYAYLGTELGREPPGEGHPYREWVETYADEEFQALAALIESLLDRYSTGSPREREHYHRAMALEHAFFEAAWQATGEGARVGR